MVELTLGDLVRKRRIELNLTQAELAEIMNVDSCYISRIETGARKPNLDSLKSFANALNVSSDYLLGIESNIFLHNCVSDMEKVLQNLVEEDRLLMINWFYEFAAKCKTKEFLDK